MPNLTQNRKTDMKKYDIKTTDKETLKIILQYLNPSILGYINCIKVIFRIRFLFKKITF